MARFTLELYCWGHDELEEYLLSLKGVERVKVENEKNVIVDIEYNPNLTDYKILKMEVMYFLNALKIPPVVSFDKHNPNAREYTLNIKDVDCDFCFMGMMQDIFETDGIESASSDFDGDSYSSGENTKVKISYDPKVITEEKIKELEKKLNYQ